MGPFSIAMLDYQSASVVIIQQVVWFLNMALPSQPKIQEVCEVYLTLRLCDHEVAKELGPTSCKWGHITPISRVITPVTHLQGHL